jgi:hypothetical protein
LKDKKNYGKIVENSPFKEMLLLRKKSHQGNSPLKVNAVSRRGNILTKLIWA